MIVKVTSKQESILYFTERSLTHNCRNIFTIPPSTTQGNMMVIFYLFLLDYWTKQHGSAIICKNRLGAVPDVFHSTGPTGIIIISNIHIPAKYKSCSVIFAAIVIHLHKEFVFIQVFGGKTKSGTLPFDYSSPDTIGYPGNSIYSLDPSLTRIGYGVKNYNN